MPYESFFGISSLFLFAFYHSNYIFPLIIWVLSTWKVARLLGTMTYSNYEDKVNEAVVETIKEIVCQRFIDPFLSQLEISMPRGHASIELITIMLGENNSNNLIQLSLLYNRLEQGDAEMYLQVLSALLQLII